MLSTQAQEENITRYLMDILWTGVTGISHANTPVTSDMLFGIGSITKTFIAAITLQLYEEGSLNLSDSIYHYLSSYKHIDSTITIKQLLNHTSGIYNFSYHPARKDSMDANPTKIWNPEEVIELFVKEPDFPADSSYKYSNTNYLLLGLIIEEITGNDITVELQNRIKLPLGIEPIYLFPDESYSGQMAHLWSYQGGLHDITHKDTSIFSIGSTAGAILSTPSQLVNWLHSLYAGKVLHDSTLNIMLTPTPQSENCFGPGTAYGLGIELGPLITGGKYVIGNSGEVYHTSFCYHYPLDSVTIAIQANHSVDIGLALNFFESLVNKYISYTYCKTANTNIFCRAYPNPFTQSIIIEYELNQPKNVDLSIYNQTGQLLYQEHQTHLQGSQKFIWDATEQPAAIYYCRIQAGNAIVVKKLVKTE